MRAVSRQARCVALAAGVAAGAALLGAAAFGVARVLRELHVHFKLRTMFGPAAVLDVEDNAGKDVRVLVVGGSYQSASYLGPDRFGLPFAYYRAFDAMRAIPEPPRLVCMVGGGAYAYAKHAIRSYPEVKMDVVEIDPTITELAKRYFFLDELIERYGEEGKTEEVRLPDGFEASVEDHGRLRLVCANGRAWLEHAEPMSYDAIVNDAFSGSRVPPELAGANFARVVREALSPSGLYLVNVVANGKRTKLEPVQAAARDLLEVFAHVWLIQADDDTFQSEENYVLVASDAEYAFPGAIPYEGA